MKLKPLLIILVVFFILMAFSSPYATSAAAKKTTAATTKINLFPSGLVLAPLTNLNPNIQFYYAALKNYISQLQSTTFTRSYYSDSQWKIIVDDSPVLQANLINFFKIHNKYAKDPNILTNCTYLYGVNSISDNSFQWIANIITADPGLVKITNGQFKTITYPNGTTQLELPFYTLVSSLIGNSPC